jgi:hypothetical protein
MEALMYTILLFTVLINEYEDTNFSIIDSFFLSACTNQLLIKDKISVQSALPDELLEQYEKFGISFLYPSRVLLACHKKHKIGSVQLNVLEDENQKTMLIYPKYENCNTAEIVDDSIFNQVCSLFPDRLSSLGIKVFDIEEDYVHNFIIEKFGRDCKYNSSEDSGIVYYSKALDNKSKFERECALSSEHRFYHNKSNQLYFVDIGSECPYWLSDKPDKCAVDVIINSIQIL